MGISPDYFEKILHGTSPTRQWLGENITHLEQLLKGTIVKKLTYADDSWAQLIGVYSTYDADKFQIRWIVEYDVYNGAGIKQAAQ